MVRSLITLFLFLNKFNIVSLESNNRKKNITFCGEDTVTEYSYDESCNSYEKYQKPTNFYEGSRKKGNRKKKSTRAKHSKNCIEEKNQEFSLKKKFLYLGIFFSVIYLIYLYKRKKQSNFMSKNEPFRIV